jgi:acyl-CoA hydrolase
MNQRALTLRFLAEPQHVNFGGKVHGGQVMKWIDQAAYACASGWCGRYCVTAYVGGIQFTKPIAIGDVVDVAARVILTGRSSMHIAVDVSAREPKAAYSRDTTSCVLVFVALDEQQAPTAVPTFEPQSDEDRALQHYGERLKALEAAANTERALLRQKLGKSAE